MNIVKQLLEETRQILQIVEARRNPEQNPKQPYLAELIKDRYENSSNPELEFVSFRNINKLGVNPDPYEFSTPVGVYGYPLEMLYKQAQTSDSVRVPFRGDASHVYFFSVDPSNVIDLDNPDPTLSRRAIDAGFKLLDHFNVPEESRKYLDRDASTGEEVWTTIMSIASKISNQENKKLPQVLTKIFTRGGISGVIDQGKGIIHKNEPAQGVFFKTEILKNQERFENRSPSSNEKPTPEKIKQAKADKVENMSLDELVQYVTANKVGFGLVKNPEVMKQLNIMSLAQVSKIPPEILDDIIEKNKYGAVDELFRRVSRKLSTTQLNKIIQKSKIVAAMILKSPTRMPDSVYYQVVETYPTLAHYIKREFLSTRLLAAISKVPGVSKEILALQRYVQGQEATPLEDKRINGSLWNVEKFFKQEPRNVQSGVLKKVIDHISKARLADMMKQHASEINRAANVTVTKQFKAEHDRWPTDVEVKELLKNFDVTTLPVYQQLYKNYAYDDSDVDIGTHFGETMQDIKQRYPALIWPTERYQEGNRRDLKTDYE